MIKFINAKINLGLNVLRRRADGYHDLSTVFYPVGTTPGILNDILEIIPSGEDSMLVTGTPLDCTLTDNIVWKALQIFRQEYPQLPPQKIILEKHIPSQAGLGGGSADASFTLIALNEICGNPFDKKQLINLALRLGADCPFFIFNCPCYATGVGEHLTPIPLSLKDKWLTIVKPKEGISTQQAFSHITPAQPEENILSIISRPIETWRNRLNNDFEQSMFAIHPELKNIKATLYHSGALYASMSGSGSTFYGIFEDSATARQAALTAQNQSSTAFTTILPL